MNIWTVRGYGVDGVDLNTSTDAEIAFLKKYYPGDYENMLDDLKASDIDASDAVAYNDFCDKWIADFEDENGNTGFMGIFAGAIKENEGIDVEYYNGDGDSAILYTYRLPWEMTDKEKALTEADLHAVFKKYLDELGVEALIDTYSVTFCD